MNQTRREMLQTTLAIAAGAGPAAGVVRESVTRESPEVPETLKEPPCKVKDGS